VLDSIDETLERFFRATVPLSAADVDVSFEAPDRTWSAKLNRPTVNMFLWDIKRSTDRARTGVQEYEQDGVRMRRLALPRVELRYLVSAWTSEHADERALVGALLQTVLGHSDVPAEFVSPALASLSPLSMTLTRSGDTSMDVFKTLEGQLKPALDMVIVTDVDTRLGRPTAGLVGDIGLNIADVHGAGSAARSRRVAGEVRVAGAAGRQVLSPHGTATIDATGRFLVRAMPGDQLTIELDPPRVVTVPSHGGVVVT